MSPVSERSIGARILIVIPCLNESRTICELISEIQSLGPDYDTLVIDDGSSDNTYECARRLTRCVKLPLNLGIGGAVQTGIKYGFRHGYDLCLQVDGDGQHPPEQIRQLLDAYLRNPTNIVVGSRYLDRDGFRSTWARRAGSALISAALRVLVSRVSLTDPTSGMRLLDRRAMSLFVRHYPHDFPEPISLAWAIRSGLTISEAAVVMRSREYGQSTIMSSKALSYMVRILSYIAVARFQRLDFASPMVESEEP